MFRYEANPSLGQWVHTQRTVYRQGKMQHERKKKLDQIGFVWCMEGISVCPTTTSTTTNGWKTRYNELVDYKLEHGHCNVPKRYFLSGPFIS